MIKNIYQFLIKESIRKKVAYFRSDLGNPSGLPSDVLCFKRKKIVFIHIPKAAGVSLFYSIFGRDSFGHRTMRHYIKWIGQEELNDYYKFTFVRNPYDRLHSAYHYLRKGGRNRQIDLNYAKKLSDYINFEDFVLRGLQQEEVKAMEHFLPQMFYLMNDQGEVQLDFIGKFENIEKDYLELLRKIEMNSSLQNKNKNTENLDYMSGYNNAMLDVVNEIYSEDFQYLEYEKIVDVK